MPSNEQVLLQLANGLHYLHTQDILHGDIKPENILISSMGESVQMKWTRFGFRQSNLNDSFSLTLSATKMGLRKWWPPEMDKDKKKISKRGEIFSAGCVFLYFLSGGIHPFPQDVLRESDELDKNVSRRIPVKFIGK
jgi:serine/threonine-protein kinase/endoribonuclease IRE1